MSVLFFFQVDFFLLQTSEDDAKTWKTGKLYLSFNKKGFKFGSCEFH